MQGFECQEGPVVQYKGIVQTDYYYTTFEYMLLCNRFTVHYRRAQSQTHKPRDDD